MSGIPLGFFIGGAWCWRCRNYRRLCAADVLHDDVAPCHGKWCSDAQTASPELRQVAAQREHMRRNGWKVDDEW